MKTKIFKFYVCFLALISVVMNVKAQDVFTEGFEGETFPPVGWTSYVNGDAGLWARATSFKHSDPASAGHTPVTGDNENWLVTPELEVTSATSELNLWAAFVNFTLNSATNHASVWISEGSADPEDNDFVLLEDIDAGAFANAAWNEINISLSAYEGKKVFIAFKYESNSSNAYHWYIDDIEIVGAVMIINAQPPVITIQPDEDTEVTMGDIFTLEVTATSPDGGDLGYQWYKNNTDDNTGGEIIVGATDETYEVPTDEVGVFYYYVVITNEIDDNGDGGNKTAIATSTVATVTVVVPVYTEDFTETSFPPAGWTSYVNGDAGQWARATTFSHSAPASAGHTPVTGNNENWLVTPELEVMSATSELNLWAAFVNFAQNSATNHASVWLSEGSADPEDNDFVLLEDIDAGAFANAAWSEINISLGAYESKTVFIAFKYESNSSSAYHWYIDDVEFVDVKAKQNAKSPTIDTQPQDALLFIGDSEDITVIAESIDGGVLTYQWYETTDPELDGDPIAGATDAAYEVPTDTEGTFYYYVVITNTIADNGDGGNKTSEIASDVATVTVEKKVIVITDFPFTEGFEDTTFPPEGWTRHNLGASTAQQWSRNTNATYIRSGSGSAMHAYAPGAIEGWLVTPAISIPDADEYLLTFWSRGQYIQDYNYNGVWISTESNDPATFIELEEIDPSAAWREVIISLADYAGETIYLAFKYEDNYGDRWCIDDISVDKAPLVITDFPFTEGFEGDFLPEGWTSHNVSGSSLWAKGNTSQSYNSDGSARITYTMGMSKEGWLVTPALSIPTTDDYLLKFMSRVQGYNATYTPDAYSGVWVSTGSNNPASFIELKEFEGAEMTNTAWQEIVVSLSAYSGQTIYIAFKYFGTDGHTWTVDDVSIEKAPLVITDFPYSEGFEGVFPPEDWTLHNVSGSSLWAKGNTSQSYNSDGSARITYTMGMLKEAWLVTPALSIPNTGEYLLTFMSRVQGYNATYTPDAYSGIWVSTGTNDPASFIELKEFEGAEITNTAWQEIVVSLSAYSGQTIYIAFKYFGTEGHTWTVDDISVDVIQVPVPVIDVQPQSIMVTTGDEVILTVEASVSEGELTYQWYKANSATNSGGVAIGGETTPAYEVPTDVEGTYYFYVEITNTLEGEDLTATTTSEVATVTVLDVLPPDITEQPEDTEVSVGETFTLTVVASSLDDGELTYQWYINETASNVGGEEIEDATEAVYEFSTEEAGTYYYYVVVTNTIEDGEGEKTAETVSDVATVTVTPLVQAPVISGQPQNRTATVGETVTLSVTATSPDGGELTYQWYRNFTATNEGGEPIAEAVEATFDAPTLVAGVRYYYVVVTNTIEDGDGEMSETTTSSVATVTVNEPIYALLYEGFEGTDFPPAGWTRYGGTGAMGAWNRTTAGGYFRGTASAGGTSGMSAHTSWLVTPPIIVPDNGNDVELSFWYRHQSTGGTSEVWVSTEENGSNPTEVEFTLLETVSESAAEFVKITISLSDYVGETIYIGFKHANPGMFGASWFIDDVMIEEVTENAEKPVITTQPQNRSESIGTPVTLSVVVAEIEDDGELTYQWYSNTVFENFGGTEIEDATTDTYELPEEVVEEAGVYYYYVVITNDIDDNGDGGRKTATTVSNVARVEITTVVNAKAPEIIAQPQDVNVSTVDEIVLTVDAISLDEDGVLTYQWFETTDPEEDGEAIEDEESEEFTTLIEEEGTYYYYVIITNTIPDNDDGGVKTAFTKSEVATVTVAKVHAQTPTLTVNPLADQTVQKDEEVTLSVTVSVSDGGDMTYQWYRNTSASNAGGTAIEGATERTFDVNTAAAGTYYFYVVITNTIENNGDGGNKTAIRTSDVAIVKVTSDIFITEDFEDADDFPPFGWDVLTFIETEDEDFREVTWRRYDVSEGQNTFFARDEGSAYHGRFDDRFLGSMENMLITPGLLVVSDEAEFSFFSRGQYFVNDNDDNHAGVWISTSGKEPEDFELLLSLSSADMPSNSWAMISVPLGDYEGQEIYIALKYGGKHYQEPELDDEGNQVYRLDDDGELVLDDDGNPIPVINTRRRTFNWWVDDVLLEGLSIAINAALPVITTHPVGVPPSEAGVEITVSVVATSPDDGTLNYQWYVNENDDTSGGAAIEGATEATYSFIASESGEYYYYVVVTNSIADNGDGGVKARSLASSTALITIYVVAQEPVIATHPQSASIDEGTSLTLSVVASSPDGGTLSYQWWRNTTASSTGGATVGTNQASYALPSDVTGLAGVYYYYVVVTNTIEGGDNKSVASSVATITVTKKTGVEDLQSNPLTAWVRDGILHVTGLTVGETLNVYTINGAAVYRSVASSEEADIPVPANGVYIVTNGNSNIKVVIE